MAKANKDVNSTTIAFCVCLPKFHVDCLPQLCSKIVIYNFLLPIFLLLVQLRNQLSYVGFDLK